MSDHQPIELGNSMDRYGGRDARKLQRELNPQRDLWPGIAARIGAGRSHEDWSHRPVWQQLAAAVVLVVMSALTTLWLSDRLPFREEPVASNAEPGSDYMQAAMPAKFGTLGSLDTVYRQDRASLTVAVMLNFAQLPDETRARLLESLADIHRAIAEINSALEQDPNNLLLQQLLMTTYQDELSVLANVNGVIGSSPTRSDI